MCVFVFRVSSWKIFHAEAIRKNYDVLQRCTTINFYVIDYLRAEDVLDEAQEHDLKTERNPLKQRILLFQWLKEVPCEKYESFLQVMKDTEQEHVAKLLEGSTEGNICNPNSSSTPNHSVTIHPFLIKISLFSHLKPQMHNEHNNRLTCTAQTLSLIQLKQSIK